MLRAMLEFLDLQSRQAIAPVDLNSTLLLRDPRKTRIVVAGQIHTIEDTPDARAHKLDSIEDLIHFANRFQDFASDTSAYAGPSVWHSIGAITCLVDDSERIDTAMVNLVYGSQFTSLDRHAKDGSVSQVAFVRFLRFGLGLTEAIIGPFRRLAWNSNTTGTTVHGASSMGKSIEAISNGTDQLPDRITLEIPIYSTRGADTHHKIPCGVDVDVDNQRLQLVPEPDAIERAIDAAQGLLRKALREGLHDSIPVYYGTP
jgi:hypothetical protein